MYLCISFGYYFPSFTTAPHPHPKEETLIKNGCYNLECCSRVLDEQLLAGAAGEVACPVGTGRDGVGVEVVALHRPRQVGSVHVMHVAAGGRVQQVHLAARPLLQEDKFNVHVSLIARPARNTGNWFLTPSQPSRLYQGDVPSGTKGHKYYVDVEAAPTHFKCLYITAGITVFPIRLFR